MAKLAKDILEWRERQKTGAIMKPSTFEKIKRSATARGATSGKRVAGAAYWQTVKAKHRGRKKRKKPVPKSKLERILRS